MKSLKLDITIEPAIFLFALSNSFASSGLMNLMMARTCAHEHKTSNNSTNVNSSDCIKNSTGNIYYDTTIYNIYRTYYDEKFKRTLTI